MHQITECKHVYESGQCTFCGASFLEEDIPVPNFTGGTAVENPSLNTKQDVVIKKLKQIGTIPTKGSEHLQDNVGKSNYAQHTIQPWAIWQDWKLNPFDADIIKRTLRTKEGASRIEDYEKIIHIATERIRQLKQ